MNKDCKDRDARKAMKTVLVVDDDLEWINLASDVLKGNYHVRSATDGDRALCLAIDTKPNIIILDVMMPGGKDGFTVFCELRKNPGTRNIPVIMLTQVNEATQLAFDSKVMKQYLGSAPSSFLEKPVTAEQLRKAVEKAVQLA